MDNDDSNEDSTLTPWTGVLSVSVDEDVKHTGLFLSFNEDGSHKNARIIMSPDYARWWRQTTLRLLEVIDQRKARRHGS